MIVFPVSATEGCYADVDTEPWLLRVWGTLPDFPDLPEELPPEPVAMICCLCGPARSPAPGT